MSSEDEAISQIAEGAARGILNWTKEQVTELANKLRNRNIAFIQNKETIDIIREQLKTAEWDVYKRYIRNKELRVLTQMGLTLRKLEKDKVKLQYLRDKIFSRYGASGVRIAEFVQSKFLNIYLGSIISSISSSIDIEKHIGGILTNVDKNTAFIREEDEPAKRAEIIKTQIWANQPDTFILCSYKSANPIARSILKNLKSVIQGYNISIFEDAERFACLFNKN